MLSYYERNKEKSLNYAREYYNKNRLVLNERNKEYFRNVYYPKNKDKLNMRYKKNNDDIINAIPSEKTKTFENNNILTDETKSETKIKKGNFRIYF